MFLGGTEREQQHFHKRKKLTIDDHIYLHEQSSPKSRKKKGIDKFMVKVEQTKVM